MFVSTEETKAIWILTINNPPLNIITPVFFAEFEVVLKQYFQDREAKILIITGAGDRAFSMGADITEIASIDNAAQGRVLAKRGQDLYDQVENSDKPIIAAINSMCFGGANELILACHLRIASEKSKFAQSEINLGIIPGWGATQRLPRLIGTSRARKIILTGDMITAQEAYDIGMIDEIVQHGEVLNRSMEIAKKIIRNSQFAVAYAQKAIREGMKKSLSEGIKIELDCFEQVCASEDMKEGIHAYINKRQPQYKNR